MEPQNVNSCKAYRLQLTASFDACGLPDGSGATIRSVKLILNPTWITPVILCHLPEVSSMQ